MLRAWCAVGRTEIRLLPHCSPPGVEEHLGAIFRVMSTPHYTSASGFVYANFDIYWIAVAIAAVRVAWGIV